LRRLVLLGEVVRVDDKSFLAKVQTVPKLAAKVFNSKGREIGYVSNVFGRVSTPYITVKLTGEDSVREGEAVYAEKT